MNNLRSIVLLIVFSAAGIMYAQRNIDYPSQNAVREFRTLEKDKYFFKINPASDTNTLPFVKNRSRQIDYPSVGFGVALSFLSVDFGPIQAFFKQAEAQINQPNDQMDFNPYLLLTFSLYLHIYKIFGIEVETGTSVNSDVDFYHSGIFVQFQIPFNKPGWLKPFIETGIVKKSFHVEKQYDTDPDGGYVNIISRGDKLGYIIKSGFDIGDPYYNGLSLFASYSFVPEITNDNYSVHTSVKLGGFQLGTGLRVYF